MDYTQSVARSAVEPVVSAFGPEDVRCTPRRCLAYILDTMIIGGLGIGLSIVGGWWYSTTEYVYQFGQPVPVTMWHVHAGLGVYLALVGISLGYFVVLEWAAGWTIGKVLFGIRVVDFAGGQISLGQAVVRNLMRIVDGLFGWLVGLIVILMSDRRQRLGDKVARTLVVRS